MRYNNPVISSRFLLSLTRLAGVCFCLLGGFFPVHAAELRQIHLRNETIVTPPRAEAGAPGTAAAQVLAPDNGLFLVQFEAPPTAATRAELRNLGVELVRFVPDLAYIARFRNTPADTVRAHPAVRWVGAYRPDHKIHPRLAAAAVAQAAANGELLVVLQLVPQASFVEVGQVRAQLLGVEHESRLRQGIFLRARVSASKLAALSQSAVVLWLELAPRHHVVDEAAAKLVGGDDGQVATPTITQQQGFAGQGVTVCVADTGLDTGNTNTMHPDVRGRVSGFLFYGNVTDGSDGYGHGSHCAGIVAGNAATGETDPDSGALYGLGVASATELLIQRIFDAEANEVSPFPSDATLTRDAVRHGAQVGSNSWGSDVNGEYDTDAAQFDELVRDADPGTPGDQPYILEFSAGNAGSAAQTMDSPATGKNVLATGASENVTGTLAATYGLYADGPDTMADFSSRGPCEDGRIKPDVVAPGSWISSIASSAAPNLASVAWSTIDGYYVYMGGTSMSGPQAAGAAAVFVQYWKSLHTNALPSPALVKAALINSANELDQSNGGPGSIPNFDEGWGRITLTNLIITNVAAAPRAFQFVDQTAALTNGQVYTYHVFVRSANESFKATLAYTDVPGFAGAIPALVNNLDLEVVAPDGTLYRGNQFSAGESVPNPPSPDTLNNVEAVHLGQPLPGDYLVRVRATSIVEDALLATTVIDQDFALVVSGDLARGGVGQVLLDRPQYTAPGLVKIEVFDAARAGTNSVSVLAKSATEPLGENYTLTAAGNYGVFTGQVATVVGVAAKDGKLELHNNDSIEVDYVDTTKTTRSATATAQLTPPAITGVYSTNDLGIIAIAWQTSEPATAAVYYSTNLTFNLGVTNLAFTTTPLLKLSRLAAGRTYHYYVVATDAAGNVTTNNNAGAYFTFTGLTAPTVLLVDDYDSAGEDADGSYVIPDSVYTNALAAAGFSFSFWKVNDRGYPVLQDLQGFPVVMWRTTDDIINYSGTNFTIPAPQQGYLQAYLNGGGSFFMASMGVLSQLGDVPFRQDVLQVAGFGQNPDPPSPCADCDEFFGVPVALGSAVSPVTKGLTLNLDYSNYPNFDLGDGTVYGPDFADTFTPNTNANSLFFESVSGKPCGMSFPGFGRQSPGRVIFLGFPLDAIPATGAAPNNEAAVLQKCLNFLAPGANGNGVVFLDNTTYTAPDLLTVQVGDSDLIGTGSTTVTLATSSSSRKITLTLPETSHRGLFQGQVGLVTANPATNQLALHGGDTITVTYFDASNNRNVIATAGVDTNAPVIGNVSATTDYGDATVTWTTSKPADSLVQYGEATLLDRTVYSPALVTSHSVTISGLAANRVYHYNVVSRDAPGNVTVEDNQGQLYTFTTLRAPTPPWFSDLEGAPVGWSVVADPSYGSDVNWQLGTPNNALANAAHSGTNAWGSNLYGTSLDASFLGLIATYLYSPVIDLSGLSTATLTFWDTFDFSSMFEQGQILISTNSATAPGSNPVLADFSGLASAGWQQETLDLTPFVGHVIRVVWNYVGVQLSGPLSGWTLDDVGITGVGGGGTIVVLKNLGQGGFTLSGPYANITGTAPLNTFSNLPPGPYTLDFDDVTFYQTPASISTNLGNGATVTLSGTYGFFDVNHNGISDAWEEYYFGNTATNRTSTTDTDHDGMPDYAEFIAGTDPTNSLSNLRFLTSRQLTNGLVNLQWSAVPGRLYQVATSTNTHAWQPLTDWRQAQASPMTYTTTNAPAPRTSRFYRIQVRP